MCNKLIIKETHRASNAFLPLPCELLGLLPEDVFI